MRCSMQLQLDHLGQRLVLVRSRPGQWQCQCRPDFRIAPLVTQRLSELCCNLIIMMGRGPARHRPQPEPGPRSQVQVSTEAASMNRLDDHDQLQVEVQLSLELPGARSHTVGRADVLWSSLNDSLSYKPVTRTSGRRSNHAAPAWPAVGGGAKLQHASSFSHRVGLSVTCAYAQCVNTEWPPVKSRARRLFMTRTYYKRP